MTPRFTGSFEELQERLSRIKGTWREIDENQKQLRTPTGGILNWYPSTGTINFQGPLGAKIGLKMAVTKVLSHQHIEVEELDTELPQNKQSTTSDPLKADGVSPTEFRTAVEAAETDEKGQNFLGQQYSKSELVIGLVAATGTDLKPIIDLLSSRLQAFRYQTEEIRVSRDIIPLVAKVPNTGHDEFERITAFMDAGNEARRESGDNSILALGAAARIAAGRNQGDESDSNKHRPRRAYIINSLKHPEEVFRLREIYPEGFYLVGVYSESVRRHRYLTRDKQITPEHAEKLMVRDEREHCHYGQRTSDTFHMSDFFIQDDENKDLLKSSVWRVLEVLFGHPYVTPTFDEYAMFMAFSASLRSADLSRQVGAVVSKNREIIATGANDCPKFGGGLYWPEKIENEIKDIESGRDHTRGEDANRTEQQKIIEDIVARLGESVTDTDKLRQVLEESRISDITEYGRVVHAEMESLLSCARNHVSTRGATVYCTTFPCHNCAKHIIAAGIHRVVYVEPYPKSKAAEFHSDSIRLGFAGKKEAVHFEPFVGVGPRRFFDLFSMRLGSGYRLRRKSSDGQTVTWSEESARLRIQMLPCSYIGLENLASEMFDRFHQFRRRSGDV